MAKVIDIERMRVDRLADELLPAIRHAFAGPGIYKALAPSRPLVCSPARCQLQHVGVGGRVLRVDRRHLARDLPRAGAGASFD